MSFETSIPFGTIARLPAPDDNVAIVTRRLEAGIQIEFQDGTTRTLKHTVLLGHRIAARPIPRGAKLLSWELPFGTALGDIEPGDYVCNAFTVDALAARDLPGAVLPDVPNFSEQLSPYEFDERSFSPAKQVPPVPDPRTFSGYRRGGGRGVGTRNFIVVLGTSSRTGALARSIARRVQDAIPSGSDLSGIVAVAHTEGGGPNEPNNRAEVVRTLAGFMTHPNVGAVIAIDHGHEPVNNEVLRAFLTKENRPIGDVPHAFLSTMDSPDTVLERAESIIREWVPVVAAAKRTLEPLSELKVALQCGGSDAFSGVSGNPLAAMVAREIIRHGGAANQAETDELVGAEAYMLRHVRDAETARRFLATVARFKERLSWHGSTAEGNPSAGNRLRGLYNITLKSLGAAAKKAPDVRMDHVIDYAEPLPGPGFTFMDSPGNDLESIAGQIASGCNVIFFTTGNGSITNFPFVPTLKFTTTTERHELLINEMDVNAGAYLDGTSMDELTAQTFDLSIEVAGGRLTKGERAGHSQVSIWRDWRQTGPDHWQPITAANAPDGRPLVLPGVEADQTSTVALERVGLVMPTSLCAGQIARMAAERLNASGLGRRRGLSRVVSLTHSEGCGFAGDRLQDQLLRTYIAYGTHPLIAVTLFLEHGCERTPNDLVKRELENQGVDPASFGWASIQLDGGIDRVLAKIETWFESRLERERAAPVKVALAVGIVSEGGVPPPQIETLVAAIRSIISSGGSVLVPEADPVLANEAFRRELIGKTKIRPTLGSAQRPAAPGFHVVATESSHWLENASGLGACGAQVIVAAGDNATQPNHPLLSVIRLQDETDARSLHGLLTKAVAGDVATIANAIDESAFQITRGLLGVSA